MLVGVAAYVVAALLMKSEPVVDYASDAEQEFYESYTSNRSLALRRLHRIYRSLHGRIQRLEGRVTAKEYDWDRRMQES